MFRCVSISLFILLFGFSFLFSNALIVKFVSGDFYPPFIWLDNNENLKGLSIDLLEPLKSKTGLDFEIKLISFHKALNFIKMGNVDMINLLFRALKREKYMIFSNPILEVESKKNIPNFSLNCMIIFLS